MPAVPKPEKRPPKPCHPLRSYSRLQSKTGLKTKSRMKQGKSNPFPDHIKKQIYEQQNGRCAYSGLSVADYKNLEYHHISGKGSGQTSTEWEHDYRNGVGLLPSYHKPMLHMGTEQNYWKMVWEARNILKYGWWRGQEINSTEWAEINEYRLKKASLTAQEIFTQAVGKALAV